MAMEDEGATTELDDELDGVEDQLGSEDDLGEEPEGEREGAATEGDGEEERPTRSMKDWLKADLAEERKRRQQAEARLQALEREQAERDKAAAERAIEEAKAEWQAAYRSDDADGLEKANAKLVAAQVKAMNAPSQDAESSGGEVAAATEAWVEANPWFRRDAARTKQAIELNNALLDEGYDPTHPRFYAELDKRMRAKPRMNGSKAIGGVTRDQQGGESREAARLTEQDKARMRRFQLDPNDPGARAEWLKSKRRLSEAAR
jgi:hypothetical protein